MEEYSRLSNILRRERGRRGLSRDELAAMIGCDTRTIARWELGEGSPRPFHRQQLMRIFEKSAEELGFVELKITEDLRPSKLRTEDLRPDKTKDKIIEEMAQNLQSDLSYAHSLLTKAQHLSTVTTSPPKVNWTPIIIATIWLITLTIPIVITLVVLLTRDDIVIPGLLILSFLFAIAIGPIQTLKKVVNSYLPPQMEHQSSTSTNSGENLRKIKDEHYLEKKGQFSPHQTNFRISSQISSSDEDYQETP